jgi:hypothetical protein
MRISLMSGAALLCALAGCASATGSTPQENGRVVDRTNTAVLRSRDETVQNTVHVAAKQDAIFAALADIYPALGVNIALQDPATGEFGNRNFSKMYRLGGVQLSNYLGCGITSTGPGADSFLVTMSLVSHVTPDATGSTVVTRLDATAQDQGSSSARQACLTTGQLEQKVSDLLVKQVGR